MTEPVSFTPTPVVRRKYRRTVEKNNVDPVLAHWNAKVAALMRDRADADPELIDARRNQRAARIAWFIRKERARFDPKLTADQRRQLIALIQDKPDEVLA